MKKYDIAVIVSEVGLDLDDMEATNTLSATFREVSEDKLLELKIPIAGLFAEFQNMFEEEK
jgi:hypothetical protein